MRKELANSENIRDKFTAIFVRYGSKLVHRGTTTTTLLFEQVRNSKGILVAGHLWFTTTREFEKFSFNKGDRVSFDARVKEYTKGYKGFRKELGETVSKDFKLSYPTNVDRRLRD